MHGGSEIYNYAFCILVLEVLTSTFLDWLCGWQCIENCNLKSHFDTLLSLHLDY
jgi:hypothetical protein